MLPATHGVIWAIVALTLSGVICRPWRVPEAVWAVLGAAHAGLTRTTFGK